MAARRLQEVLAHKNAHGRLSNGRTRRRILVKEVNCNNVNENIPMSERNIPTKGNARRIRSSRSDPIQRRNGKYFVFYLVRGTIKVKN